MNKRINVGPNSGVVLLKSKEVAEILNISDRKLWALTKSGEIRHVRIGRAVRYSVDHLREWIDSQTKGGAV